MTNQARASSAPTDGGPSSPLDGSAAIPLYRQLLADLRRRIFAGEFDRASQLPSEAGIERAYGVSRITVRRALQELEQQGLIQRRQGRPTRLTPRRLHGPAEAELDAELVNILSVGFRTETRVIDMAIVPASAEIAARLDVRPAAPVHRVVRLRRMGGAPLCRSLAYLPVGVMESLSRATLESEPLLLVLVRSGLVIDRVEQSIAAVTATPELAGPLEVEEHAPLLLIERLFRDDRGRPVQLVYLHFRADRYRYGMTFRTARDKQQSSTRVEPVDMIAGES
ncbi:transcriptional regulator, GntR family [Tistlia consotensis]|uniref:Transcriptional regulator, GntR family n=1 Tax=Tistlia consotensis USBA 355 TaxID=560819 RepID=A0A1Y6BJZ7_9PROT|nr:GntR family transcriptional regulator [Tistlia consotensis]SMF14048.1 transcriptional regulator, GntR family [Tistlia consotensis USBA 355]SNR49942.1 transcriptional regulator, GntR family [Tistlia consotensis]